MIVIDRFEGDFALCEVEGQIIQIPRSCIPPQAVEGSALRLVVVDNWNDRKRIAQKQNRLFK